LNCEAGEGDFGWQRENEGQRQNETGFVPVELVIGWEGVNAKNLTGHCVRFGLWPVRRKDAWFDAGAGRPIW
jgi:hypothetical protein